MTTIQEINNRINAKGNQLANGAKKAIYDITLHGKESVSSKPSKDVPSRPWFLVGGIGLATGIIGAMLCDSKWPYCVGTLGLVAFGVGFTKRNTDNNNTKSYSSNLNIDEEKAFIVEKCNKILDQTKNDWDEFMDSLKSEVQCLIKSSSISEDKKEEYLSFTYYPETLSLSTLSLIDKFDTIFSGSNFVSEIISEKAKFADEIALSISRTIHKQIEVYNKITI